MNKNKNMHKAKVAKNDEFYTRLSDIENELKEYKEQFKDKIVYCNCDDPRESNFFKYFVLMFKKLELQALVCTGYKENSNGVIAMVDRDNIDSVDLLNIGDMTNTLSGDGSFDSDECLQILGDCDIVVTNPPFSLFRDFIKCIVDRNKKFLVIGNKNALTYKEIFSIIKNRNLWLGYTIPNDFILPNNETTKKVQGLCRWFTNLETNKSSKNLTYLCKKYNEVDYPKYDNYDAINVDKVKDIPLDYDGFMGVPITIMDKVASDGFIYCDCNGSIEKFEIICSRRWNKTIEIEKIYIGDKDSCYDDFKTLINNKETYDRIFIKKVE